METEDRSFTALPCKDFVEILASKAAVPGGGGASALVGSIGVALGHMVGSLTLGKKKYASVEENIQRCQQQANALAKRLLDLMDEDARAFEPLSKAYGLPHATPEETARKAQVMEQALLTACGAPAAGGGPVHRGRLNLERVRALCYNKASDRRLTARMQGFSLQYFACAALGFPLR